MRRLTLQEIRRACLCQGLDYVRAKAKNPWAICTDSTGREDKEKYERCVLKVKKQIGMASIPKVAAFYAYLMSDGEEKYHIELLFGKTSFNSHPRIGMIEVLRTVRARGTDGESDAERLMDQADAQGQIKIQVDPRAIDKISTLQVVMAYLERDAARSGILNSRVLAGRPGDPGYYFLMHRAGRDSYYGPFLDARIGTIIFSIYSHMPIKQSTPSLQFLGWTQLEAMKQTTADVTASPLFKSPSNLSYGRFGPLTWSKVKARALKMYDDPALRLSTMLPQVVPYNATRRYLSHVAAYQKHALGLSDLKEVGKKLWNWVKQLGQLDWKKWIHRLTEAFEAATISTAAIVELSNAFTAFSGVWKNPTQMAEWMGRAQQALFHIQSAMQHAELTNPEEIMHFIHRMEQVVEVGMHIIHSVPGLMASSGADDGYDKRFIDRDEQRYIKPTDSLDDDPLQDGYEYGRS